MEVSPHRKQAHVRPLGTGRTTGNRPTRTRQPTPRNPFRSKNMERAHRNLMSTKLTMANSDNDYNVKDQTLSRHKTLAHLPNRDHEQSYTAPRPSPKSTPSQTPKSVLPRSYNRMMDFVKDLRNTNNPQLSRENSKVDKEDFQIKGASLKSNRDKNEKGGLNPHLASLSIDLSLLSNRTAGDSEDEDMMYTHVSESTLTSYERALEDKLAEQEQEMAAAGLLQHDGKKYYPYDEQNSEYDSHEPISDYYNDDSQYVSEDNTYAVSGPPSTFHSQSLYTLNDASSGWPIDEEQQQYGYNAYDNSGRESRPKSSKSVQFADKPLGSASMHSFSDITASKYGRKSRTTTEKPASVYSASMQSASMHTFSDKASSKTKITVNDVCRHEKCQCTQNTCTTYKLPIRSASLHSFYDNKSRGRSVCMNPQCQCAQNPKVYRITHQGKIVQCADPLNFQGPATSASYEPHDRFPRRASPIRLTHNKDKPLKAKILNESDLKLQNIVSMKIGSISDAYDAINNENRNSLGSRKNSRQSLPCPPESLMIPQVKTIRQQPVSDVPSSPEWKSTYKQVPESPIAREHSIVSREKSNITRTTKPNRDYDNNSIRTSERPKTSYTRQGRDRGSVNRGSKSETKSEQTAVTGNSSEKTTSNPSQTKSSKSNSNINRPVNNSSQRERLYSASSNDLYRIKTSYNFELERNSPNDVRYRVPASMARKPRSRPGSVPPQSSPRTPENNSDDEYRFPVLHSLQDARLPSDKPRVNVYRKYQYYTPDNKLPPTNSVDIFVNDNGGYTDNSNTKLPHFGLSSYSMEYIRFHQPITLQSRSTVWDYRSSFVR